MTARLLFGVGVLLMVVGCASPTFFTFQRLNYFDNTSSQAQLGNVGMQAVDGDGFLRGAFLSDCGIGEVELTVDSRVPHFASITDGFVGKASLESLGQRLGYRAEELERMSVVVVSLNPLKVTKWIKENANDECKNYFALTGDSTRVVTSVALLVDLPALQKTTAKLQVSARLTTRGRIVVKAEGLKKPAEATVSANSVFAYRYSHVCWLDPAGKDLLLQVDDSAFEACPPGYSTSMPDGWNWVFKGEEGSEAELEALENETEGEEAEGEETTPDEEASVEESSE